MICESVIPHPTPQGHRDVAPRRRAARVAVIRVSVGALSGVGASATAIVIGASSATAALLGWTCAALVFLGSTWFALAGKDAAQTAQAASSEDDRALRELVVVVASLASLGAVAIVLGQVDAAHGWAKWSRIGLAMTSVVLAWGCIQTVYTLRYARLYYTARRPPIDFHDPESPDYLDFLYIAATLGMTYQVSDTEITSRSVRRAVMPHALLCYLFGTVIVAIAINIVASLLGH